MSLWLLFYALLALLGLYAVFEHYVLQPRRDRAEYGAAWSRYDSTAFHPQMVRPVAPGVRARVQRVGVELASSGGKRAVRVRSNGGIAVHEVRADGGFSSRGPYYIKLRPCIWSPTGRLHLVEVEQGTVSASNPRGGDVYERGVQVVEWDTAHHPPVPLREYAAYERKTRLLVAAASRELPALAKGARAEDTHASWVAILKAPFGRYAWIPVVGSMLASAVLMQLEIRTDEQPISWSLLIIQAFLPGIVPGLLVGGGLIPAIARRVLATVHPDARHVWTVMRAEEKQATAKEALRRLRTRRARVRDEGRGTPPSG